MNPAAVAQKRKGAHVLSRRWSFPRAQALAGLVIIIGAAVFLYPHAASWVSQYNQSQLIIDLEGEQRVSEDTSLHAQIERAREYNELLVGGVLIEANTNKPIGEIEEEGEFDYFSLLRATESGVMGRLRIPAIDVDLPIYHGTDDYTLTKGVGHLQGTALPVGGVSRRSVLTAHRGLPEATLFTYLDKVDVGDQFTIEVYGEVLTYEVQETRVIEPDDTDSIRVVSGEDLVTLITCTPLGVNSHRIVVTGERVVPTPIEDVQTAGAPPDIPRFPWWAPAFLLVVVAVSVYVWRSGYPDLPARRRSERQGSAPATTTTADTVDDSAPVGSPGKSRG